MVAPAVAIDDPDLLPLPRGALRFPVELRLPLGFDPDDAGTWPRIDGRIEYVNGRLLYMPPCGEIQGGTCSGVTTLLGQWTASRPRFALRSNEAGMALGGDRRGADAGIWRAGAAAQPGFSRTPPILAVEVAGADEDEAALRDKARWYLDAGVEVVWIVLPADRVVVVVRRADERRYRAGERLAEHPSLPGLAPAVDEFFAQLR